MAYTEIQMFSIAIVFTTIKVRSENSISSANNKNNPARNNRIVNNVAKSLIKCIIFCLNLLVVNYRNSAR